MFRRVAEVMDFLDLAEAKGRFIDKLSGGQAEGDRAIRIIIIN
jgi:ABC-type enterochelin transport system ATPase subunit